jgi:hypothetical protein
MKSGRIRSPSYKHENKKNESGVLAGKPKGMKQVGRSRRGWDITDREYENVVDINLAHDKDQKRVNPHTAKNFWVALKTADS